MLIIWLCSVSLNRWKLKQNFRISCDFYDRINENESFSNLRWDQKERLSSYNLKIESSNQNQIIAYQRSNFYTNIKITDRKISNCIHISTLLSLSTHWQAMLKHPHDEKFRKATQVKFDAIDSQDTWEIVNKSENQKIISLKWVFIYKNDSNDDLIKYKACIMIRSYLQKIDSQNVYAATLASKVFRILMILIATYHLKIR